MINLVNAISQTPALITLDQVQTSGSAVPENLVAQKNSQINTNINLFAYNVLTTIQQSEQSLLDPTNNASDNSNMLTATVAQISQAYAAAKIDEQTSSLDIVA